MSIWEQLTHLQFWQELTLQNLKEGKPHWSDVDWNSDDKKTLWSLATAWQCYFLPFDRSLNYIHLQNND